MSTFLLSVYSTSLNCTANYSIQEKSKNSDRKSYAMCSKVQDYTTPSNVDSCGEMMMERNKNKGTNEKKKEKTKYGFGDFSGW